MNNFIVSARKYRPSTFKTVVGQDYIVTTLKNAIKNNQLAQAFLFTGPRGVGKTTCARILAKTINCTNITEDFEACNQCESCRSFNELASFNVHELDAASNNSVDDIRTLVEQVRIPPQAGKYKVYIIDEVHMLSAAAFNAFLKTLEEPPSYAKFILATTEKHKIIPTILSRCQVFDFKRITIEDISKHLAYVANSEHIEFDPQALHVIASKSDGALRDALSIFDQMVSYGSNNITTKDVIDNLNILDYEFHFRLINAILEGDTTAILLILDEIYEKGFEGQTLITGFGDHLRSLLVCKDEKTLPLLEVHENLADEYLQQSRKCSVRFLIRALEIINTCDINYKSASNKRFHIELNFLKIAQLNDQQSAETEEQQQKQPSPEHKPMPEKHEKPLPDSTTEKSASTSTEDTPVQYKTPPLKATKTETVHDVDDISVMDVIKQKSSEKSMIRRMDQPFTDEDVRVAFTEFCDHLHNDDTKGYVCSIIKNVRFDKVDDQNWNLVLSSSAETEAFRSLDIQKWFREHLSNKSFNIQFVVEPRKDHTNVKTREEKMKDFIQNNPDVIRLINELGAQPDV